jgi:hypothetical protein
MHPPFPREEAPINAFASPTRYSVQQLVGLATRQSLFLRMPTEQPVVNKEWKFRSERRRTDDDRTTEKAGEGAAALQLPRRQGRKKRYFQH